MYLLQLVTGLVTGKSLLPCSPFHTSSCDSLNCQYLANRLEMNMSLHRWLSGRTHVCTSLPAPGSIRPGRRWSQDGGSRQCRPPAHLRFLVMRGRDADCERSLADLCGGPHLIQEALGCCMRTWEDRLGPELAYPAKLSLFVPKICKDAGELGEGSVPGCVCACLVHCCFYLCPYMGCHHGGRYMLARRQQLC